MKAILIKNLLVHKFFQKRLDRKPRVMFSFENLIPKLYRRDHKPFEKRLDRKSLLNLKRHDGVITSLLKKGLTENHC
ncbi:hypothetical protein MSBRW_2793 [Methanosarcina barkeri str. Wiesmoor]|uniref:Uncharacterized protein n=1 Tax=Methanosarcina barkeri str. Wiesmoor TaxID=1434109 RepID=A0A0E3LLX8_METBA|nr:hypothetical protein [Methanosarcina barkeri]AKB52046.1 hypothetical protein MSBRW_2793 [Methanosarcina barkeri str. Wiesmoor]